MKNKFKVALLILIFLAAGGVVGLYMSTHEIAVLSPKGFIAEEQRRLIIDSFLLMLIVVVPVFVLTFVFAWIYREDNEKATHSPDWGHSTVAEIVWWGVPLVIVIVLAVWTYRTSHELNPFKPIESHKKPVTVQVVALQWKWLFIYPEHGIATVNYVEFPEKRPINLVLTGDSPMNSFWIPQLGGMIYAMPKMRTQLHLIADETGVFEGLSSHFSGTGFAGMKFKARASTEEEFASWVQQVRSSRNQLDWYEYNKLVEPSSYDPVSYYRLANSQLFEQIIEKYEAPKQQVRGY